jgi:hypothetical protein
MWDNRASKKNPKKPDFKCKDRDNCDGVVWPPRGAKAQAATPPSTTGNLSASGQVKPADDRSNRIERQHSQEMALRYFTLRKMDTIDTDMLRTMIDWFQRDISRTPLSAI